jgi:pimeloyl-ACP methyl ester carboxylesterase
MAKSAATIVLVHGAWADGSSWNKVIPLLLAKNMRVIAVQLPLTSVEDDLAAINRIIAATDGPIVLVAHSWGGMAVTQAGDDPKVMALVYVSAFAPDVGESGSSLIGAHPTPPALSTIVTDSMGFVYQTVWHAQKHRAGRADRRSADFGGDPGAARGKSIWTDRRRGCLEGKALLVHRDNGRSRGQRGTPDSRSQTDGS